MTHETVKATALCPTDDEAVLPRRKPPPKLDKQSTEYVLKSGLAGGLAGCAVSDAK